MSRFFRKYAIFFVALTGQTLSVQAAEPLNPEVLKALQPETVAPTVVANVPVWSQPAEVILPPQARHIAVSSLSGRIVQTQVVVGDAVQPGQVLAQVYSPELLELQRDLVLARSAWRHAKHVHERESKLVAEGIIAQRRLDEAEHDLLERKTVLAAAEGTLLSLGLNASELQRVQDLSGMSPQLNIRALEAGTVTAVHARLGAAVTAGEPLFEYADTRKLWLTIYVDAALSAVLHEGSLVQADSCQARIQRLSDVLNADTQTLIATAEIDSPCPLKAGQQLSVRLAKSIGDSYALPSAAVINSAGADWVFAVQADTVQVLPVTVVGADSSTRYVQFAQAVPAAVARTRIADLKAAWLGMGGE